MYNRVYYTLRSIYHNTNMINKIAKKSILYTKSPKYYYEGGIGGSKMKHRENKVNSNIPIKRTFSTYSNSPNNNNSDNIWIILFAGISMYLINKK